jgi:cellulose synthase/poly-beta-1,6-N-acetylglucosamine synthase-like glycosyltransferase
MIPMMEALFWISLALIAYPYFGYLLLLKILAPLVGRPVRRAPHEPTVTFIISAYNEEKNMRRKIENTLAIDYPRDKFEILVASDASTDRTDAIVTEYHAAGIELIRLPERSGKVAGQNAAIARGRGEVLVFSDTRIMVTPESIRAMTENLADPTVGCVSSQDRIVDESGNPDPKAGEGIYVRYEMALRQAEADLGSLVGASGSFYAVSKRLADVWEPGLERDFLTPLKVAAAGLRTVHEPRAVGAYGALDEPEAEFRRKVRTVLRGMTVLFHMRGLLNPFRHPRVAWQLWSHKILRWTVPFFLVILLVSSAVLARQGAFYAVALGAQLALYALALAAYLNRRLENRLIFRIPLFFTNVNLSILVAWIRYLSGSRQVTWEPSRR